MFDKYHTIDQITKDYSVETLELEEARKSLEDILNEKEFIIEKQAWIDIFQYPQVFM